MANTTQDTLSVQSDTGFSTAFDFKGSYVSKLAEDGYERMSQYSATPDSTALFAGPARFSGLSGTASLMPIGLTDGFSISENPSLARLYEIGSNRAFFTRGKTILNGGFSKILADQANILAALSSQAYRPSAISAGGMTAPGATAPNPDIMMNLDSEYFANPFGLLVLFKTRGGGAGNGKILTATYLEYCMFSSYQFAVGATAPVIMENVSFEFDRAVPVTLSN